MSEFAETTSVDPVSRIERADLDRREHQLAVVAMLDAYAADPMGDGQPLAPEVRARLVPGLQAHPTTQILLAWVGDAPAGIAVCFVGFSTFAARPLLNLHDLAVAPPYRGRGIGRQLLQRVEDVARELACCKVTLEVLQRNPARQLYEQCGFAQVSYAGGAAGNALFMAKSL